MTKPMTKTEQAIADREAARGDEGGRPTRSRTIRGGRRKSAAVSARKEHSASEGSTDAGEA